VNTGSAPSSPPSPHGNVDHVPPLPPPAVLTALLDAAAAWPVPVVLAVAGVVLAAESGTLVGVFLPGSTLLVALGLWSLGAPHALLPAVVTAAVCTVTGAHLGWFAGRSGAPVGHARGRLGRLADARARQGGGWLAERRGPATAVLLACGHWAAVARTLLPRVAGAAGVPYRIAGPVLAVSGTAWAAAVVLAANRLGSLVLASADWVPVVVVTALVAGLVVRARARRRATAATARSATAGDADPATEPADGAGTAAADEDALIRSSSAAHAAPPAWAGDLRSDRSVLARSPGTAAGSGGP
jgi:membrane-associated protein